MIVWSLTTFMLALLMLLAVFLPNALAKPSNGASSFGDDELPFDNKPDGPVTIIPPSTTGKAKPTSGDNACTIPPKN